MPVRPEDLPTEGLGQVAPSVDDIIAKYAPSQADMEKFARLKLEMSTMAVAHATEAAAIHQQVAIMAAWVNVGLKALSIAETLLPLIALKAQAQGKPVVTPAEPCPLTTLAKSAANNVLGGLLGGL